MKSTNEDPRVRKTKKALQEGLSEIMIRKELRKITVKELCIKSDIHRATFYSHYKDIYDLYEQIEDSVVKDLKEIMDKQKNGMTEFFRHVVEYIINNKSVCKMVFRNDYDTKFFSDLTNFLEKSVSDEWKEVYGDHAVGFKMNLYSVYHISGFLSMIKSWIESEFNCPKEEFIGMLLSMDINFEYYLFKNIATEKL